MIAEKSILESLSLEGRVAIVTGGGSGLGLEMAMALALAGAAVAIAGRRLAPIEEAAERIGRTGNKALPVRADLTDSGHATRLVQTTIDELGRVDVLVNNAGLVAGQGGTPIWEITDEQWHEGIEGILTPAFYCSRAATSHMVERGSGKIVNVSSGLGVRGARDNYMYACAKGAVVQLTRSLAVSLGRFGVTANCLVPGYFPTEATGGSAMGLPRAELIPVGRAGRPDELGPIAVWLASSASDYMTGEIFAMDGGALAGGFAPTGYSLDTREDETWI